MDEDRVSYFKNLPLDSKNNLTFNDFTTSELEYIFSEMLLKDECREIAKMKFIKCLTIDEIADKLGHDKKTIIKRVNMVKLNFHLTILKLFFNRSDY